MTGIEREKLDRMNLNELTAEFDRRCEQARHYGQWLFERDRDFADYCTTRMQWLARLACGLARERQS